MEIFNQRLYSVFQLLYYFIVLEKLKKKTCFTFTLIFLYLNTRNAFAIRGIVHLFIVSAVFKT